MSTSPNQSSFSKAGPFTPASGGADKSTGTNSPIYGPLTSGIFATAFFVRTRRVLESSLRRIAEYFDASDNTAAPILKLTGALLPTSEQLRIDSPRSIRSPLFPRLVSTGQYLPGEVSDRFKSTIKFQGRTIAVVTCRKGPKPAFSLSNLLRSLVIHDPKSVMEMIRYVRKSVGKFKHEYQYRVTNSQKQNSAGRPLPISGRAHTSCITQAGVVIQQNP